MTSARPNSETKRLYMGNSVWQDVPVDQANVLIKGAKWAFVFGVLGGTVVGIILNMGFLGFVIGYALFGIVGQLTGLILASRRAHANAEAAKRHVREATDQTQYQTPRMKVGGA